MNYLLERILFPVMLLVNRKVQECITIHRSSNLSKMFSIFQRRLNLKTISSRFFCKCLYGRQLKEESYCQFREPERRAALLRNLKGIINEVVVRHFR